MKQISFFPLVSIVSSSRFGCRQADSLAIMGRIVLYDDEPTSSKPRTGLRNSVLLATAVLAGVLFYADLPNLVSSLQQDVSATPSCPKQPDPIAPAIAFTPDAHYRDAVAEHLSHAVQVQTVNYDDLGPVEEDARWEPFYDLHKLLDEQYAELYAHPAVNLTLVNKLGRITTIKGSDSSLKPVLLMSHLDVVPVPRETLNRWTYPPFAGQIDSDFVYGR